MPTYSYKCTACGNAFDTVQSFSDPALTTCDVCGGTLRKVFSPVGVTFNGSGFYRTDSRSKPSDSKPASGSSGSGAGKSDAGSGSSGSGSSSSAPSSAPASTGASS
ncbi:FmdB family zinc ribbon protein [Naasia sp. SYSU D00948]|uniref:FmdB family zinc ribbon protein n=1 Tax=Naasia sp. SYSU D00948 TaxID=2817379 RepID=UPI001B30B0B5|nr:FmdB family zinc ribbon protein [Naasia sp. SYSU D00948]